MLPIPPELESRRSSFVARHSLLAATLLILFLASFGCAFLAQHDGDGLLTIANLGTTLRATVKLTLFKLMHHLIVGHSYLLCDAFAACFAKLAFLACLPPFFSAAAI